MMRWREELVLCSLERETLGQAPSAKKARRPWLPGLPTPPLPASPPLTCSRLCAQIMDVVSDIDHELSVTVMKSDLLPPECRAKLEAKRCAWARIIRGSLGPTLGRTGAVCAPSPFAPDAVGAPAFPPAQGGAQDAEAGGGCPEHNGATPRH